MILDRRICFISVVFDQEDEDDGSNSEDEAGEADHDGRDDLLDPEAGRHVISALCPRDTCQGHVGAVHLLESVDCTYVTS